MSLRQPATGNRPPAAQIAAIRLLADSLYEATCGSLALTNQARNELGLLLTVLGATETHAFSLGADLTHLPVLRKRLHGCHDVLSDLQKLHLHPDALGAQSQISDIRARLSSAVFGLSELNTNMMISSQKHINNAVNSIADDARIGVLEPSVVSDALRRDSQVEADEAWLKLQDRLAEAGISSELADQNRDSIILNLRGVVEKDELLRTTEKAASLHKTPENTEPAAKSKQSSSLNDLDDDDLLADEPDGLPFLPLPPIGFSYSASYSNQTRSSFIRDQPLAIEEFPIPVAMENDPVDTAKCLQKECLPVENFPIPVTKEILLSDRNTPDNNLPIPVIVTSTKPKNDLDPTVLKVALRTKKTNRLSRLRWQMTSSKETFINHIKQGQNENVQHLLSKGADVNVQNELGQTALMVAASFGHEHITRTLLEYGAEIHACCQAGQTALNVAAIRGYERVVRMLVASGARVDEGKDIGKLALAQAAAYGQDRIVQFILDSGADVDAFGGNDETALGLAAVNGNMKVARMLLDHGARVNHQRSHWQLPLFKAVKANCVEMVRLLVQRGADPTLKKGKFDTSLDYARKTQRTEILRVFADYGFRPVSTAPYQYF
ncbi:uncharacterized protein N7506_008816 [Penicillium brevicompactum]|uniref:uncharacterized protein n=1 Tax=Penicillium brevicompactum TaxID=5074 RepID=UPI00253F9AC3|nr:uncharacterized protein N7506_008816 [Penicillium brevicompactum]KAJ5325714.1 hypothetical protein N7506_008816 [Penicillium brevicompactum]